MTLILISCIIIITLTIGDDYDEIRNPKQRYEIANTRSIAQKNNPQLEYPNRIVTAALEEVEQNKIGREYLDKVRSAR